MSLTGAVKIERWTPLSRAATVLALATLVLLTFGPQLFSANAVDKLTTLFIYVILALTWNALAGYGGLVSVGQQAFFGLGAYFAVRLADAGVSVYPSLLLGALITGVIAVPISLFMLKLRDGEFAIGVWVVAELCHLLVNLDTLVQGETGTSLIALNAFSADRRHALTYWAALGAMVLVAGLMLALLRGKFGSDIQAIRDNEEAAASLGVNVFRTKQVIFVLACFGAALAGALWLATAITFQPKTYFGPQWTAYMIFMVLVGGIGTFEGPIIGAVIFFAIEAAFGASGVWYLIGLGLIALIFSLVLPKGIWGYLHHRFGWALLPLGYRVVPVSPEKGAARVGG